MRIWHCMIRVGDLRRSLEFYVDIFGMTLRQEDYPDGRFTLAFLGFGDAKQSMMLELTYIGILSAMSVAITPDSLWRNRPDFLQGRAAIEAFLKRKWEK